MTEINTLSMHEEMFYQTPCSTTAAAATSKYLENGSFKNRDNRQHFENCRFDIIDHEMEPVSRPKHRTALHGILLSVRIKTLTTRTQKLLSYCQNPNFFLTARTQTSRLLPEPKLLFYCQNPNFVVTARTQTLFLLPEPKPHSFCQNPKPYSNTLYNNARSASDVKHFIEDAV